MPTRRLMSGLMFSRPPRPAPTQGITEEFAPGGCGALLRDPLRSAAPTPIANLSARATRIVSRVVVHRSGASGSSGADREINSETKGIYAPLRFGFAPLAPQSGSRSVKNRGGTSSGVHCQRPRGANCHADRGVGDLVAQRRCLSAEGRPSTWIFPMRVGVGSYPRQLPRGRRDDECARRAVCGRPRDGRRCAGCTLIL
jgi:hypothetical protein